ncbi:BLOC-3 complex member HPS4 isoform X2 [Sorex araneus]|uniref:BLOC-3 complex member HPS4 isoform X2 n=1 Tax=Sorex araneus TaxID=42254 RepID=UPI002433D8D7|nr:BLOC-3 complex member HPS4 isoform X2 [Sorex araneus]
MAAPVSTEKPASWWNYFFLYDGSKVKEEGDPTRAGICYFYPSETLLDQQELLCGQIAGVVHCVSDISGSPPTLIRLRKLKFAVRMDGDYLWVLGCAAELPDVSCRQFLEQLIGFFHFYHGPVSLAYQSRSREELGAAWEAAIEQILSHSGDLDRIFSSVWTLDPTKVEPLLLLKAALILQACQCCTHVRAGCILYQGLTVSTQLTPSLTAKVLLRREQGPPPGGAAVQEGGERLPRHVRIVPVFLTEAEAASLQDFPGEPGTSSPAPAASPQEHPAQHPPGEKSVPRETAAACTLATPPQPPALGTAQPRSDGENGLCGPQPTGVLGCPLAEKPGLSADDGEQELSGAHVPEAQNRAPSSGHCPVPGMSAPEAESPGLEDPVGGDRGGLELGPPPPETLSRDGAPPSRSGRAPVPTEEPLPPGPGGEAQGAGAAAASPADPGGSAPAGKSEARQKAARPGALVPMCLYTHSVKGLLLALLAAEPLQEDAAAVQEVYHSSLASLNGLEVHLKETLPAARTAAPGRAYNFAHYDRVQNVLTASQLQAATPQDRRFLQAVSLMHSDFAQLPTLSEITVRNASTAVYACCSPAQETYFQPLVAATRSSGFPSAQDGAFSLPGKARQRLLKHGVNLL